MGNIRCVIANMPHRLLTDIVENMVRESGALSIVDHASSLSELPSILARNHADLLIMGLQRDQVPASCLDIMDSSVELPVLGLIDDGRKLAIYLNNVGRNDIMNIIRTLPRESLQ